MRRVTSIPGAYSFEGKSYGPFEANGKTPFVEVPAVLADALGLPRHESDPSLKASESEAGEPASSGELEETKRQLDETRQLVEELKGARNLAKSQGDEQRERANKLQARVDELEGDVSRLRADGKKTADELKTAQSRVKSLEVELAKSKTSMAPTTKASKQDVPTPPEDGKEGGSS